MILKSSDNFYFVEVVNQYFTKDENKPIVNYFFLFFQI